MTDEERMQRIMEKHRRGYQQYLKWLDHQFRIMMIKPSEKTEDQHNDNQDTAQ